MHERRWATWLRWERNVLSRKDVVSDFNVRRDPWIHRYSQGRLQAGEYEQSGDEADNGPSASVWYHFAVELGEEQRLKSS